MARYEWFRRSTWTQEDQEDFFARLGRSRSLYNKSQYARIQAGHLQGAGLVHESLALLNRVLEEWPDESQIAAAYDQQGHAHLLLGNVESAMQSFRDAVQYERRTPRYRTNAFLEFAWQVATRRISDLYEEALSLLDERSDQVRFSIDKYRFSVAQAFIRADLGDKEEAQRYARIALDAARKQESGFRYHKKLGLVGDPDEALTERLQQLAAS